MLRKVADLKPPCRHSEHNPPSMILLSPGIYEHVCPGCGQKSTFTVSGTYCNTSGFQVTNTCRVTS